MRKLHSTDISWVGLLLELKKKLISVLLMLNRDRENLLTRAEEENLSIAEANRLRGQAVAVTFDDVISCINVSAAY